VSEIKKTGLKTFLDALKTYWGYAAVLSTMLSLAYARGAVKGNANALKTVDTLIAKTELKQDAVIQGQRGVREDMTKVVNVVKNLSTELIKHESKDPSVSKQDIINIMGGLQFEISQPIMEKSADPPDLKVTIKQVIPIKK
jgi:hypothetical protein